MNIKIYKLNKGMAEDYISYFDNRAFWDGDKEKGCYCVWHHWTDKHEYERSLMPEIERPYRKRDYAKALLDYACQYAEENGYDYVEGYPPHGEFTVHDCGGSVSMYVNLGFKIIDIPNGVIARKKLKANIC